MQFQTTYASFLAYIPILLFLFIINGVILWRRYQSRRALVERVQELEELSDAGRAIVAAQLDLNALSQLIVSEADKIIDTSTFQLGFFSGHFFHLQVWTVASQPQEPRTFDLREGGGLVSWVRDNKTSLLIRDFEQELNDLPAPPRYGGGTPPRSAIFIPLISGGDEVLGVLGAQSDQAYHFNEKHVRQLTIIANQAAAAIANGRLFVQERQRGAQIALIAAITQQINAADNLEEVFVRVVTLTRETFNFFQVNIFYLEPSNKMLYLRASSTAALLQYDIHFSRDDSLVGAATSLQKTIIANDARQDTRFVSAVGIPEVDESWAQVRSVFVTPLIVDDVCWGVLEVLDTEINRFDEQETEVLETLAAGVALALQKAQQLLRQRVQAWLTTARLQIANAISQSNGLSDLMSRVTRATVMLVGVDGAGILLWEPDREWYVPGELYGDFSPEVKSAFDSARPLAIGDWRALDAVHVSHEPYLSTRPWSWLPISHQRHPQRTTWLWPLLFDQHLRGVLFVVQSATRADTPTTTSLLRSTADGRFVSPELQARRQELLADIAHQVGQALERIQLRLAQEEEAWVNTALLQVAEAVNSLIDLNEILRTIVRFVPMLVGVETCVVLIWNDREELFELGPSYGVSEMGLGLLATLQIDRDELYGYLRQQSAFGAEHTDVPHYVVDLPPWLGQVLETEAARAVPLRAQGRFVGMLLVGFESNGTNFNGRRLNI
ncbi:MAG: GAF domain-containing protein, partial [Anaerolineales bacterium]|nr:GAF domain-containing protein [Anaerolineales bacterium]